MKKILVKVNRLECNMSLNAQVVKIMKGNDVVKEYKDGDFDQIVFEEEPLHEYVDLGLPSGTLWATCNIGANAPEEYGDYYAWGNTSTKSTYGNVDKRDFGVFDDVATANWGSSWRMPTDAEQEELLDNCNCFTVMLNGVKGCKLVGPNGNSIFFPAAGYFKDADLNEEGRKSFCWSSSLDTDDNSYAWLVGIGSGLNKIHGFNRGRGCSVRPVRK